WKLHVPSGIYRAVAKDKHAVMTVFVRSVKPRPSRDPEQVAKLLGELNDNAFATRENARRELEKLGNDAKPFLRAALKGNVALEMRRRIEALLDKLPGFDVSDIEIPKGIRLEGVDDLIEIHWKRLKEPDSTARGLAIQELSALTSFSDKIV